MIKLISAIAVPILLVGCHTTQSYSVPIKHYFSGDVVSARIDSVTALPKACASEFVVDGDSGALIGMASGAALASGFGAVPLAVAGAAAVGSGIGRNIGKSQSDRTCIPDGYEVKISYYHPDDGTLVSHYVVMDKKVQHPTVKIPMAWIPDINK